VTSTPEHSDAAPSTPGAPTPGAAAPGVARRRPPVQAAPFTVGNALGVGWEGFCNRYPLLLGATALYLLIVIGGKLVALFSQIVTFLPLADWAASFLFFPILLYGLLQIGHASVRGRTATIGMLFAPFNRYWAIIGVNAIVIVTVIAALYVPIGATAIAGLLLSTVSGGNAAFIWTIIAVVVVVYLAVFLLLVPRLMFAPMVCLDTEMRVSGPLESIRLAWQMTRRAGVRPRLAVLVVLGWLLLIACTLLLVLPVVLLAIPLTVTVYGAAYWQVSGAYWAAREHCCLACEYDLRDARADRCPECGAPVTDEQRRFTGTAHEPRPEPEPG
jgi:hypothetical protein